MSWCRSSKASAPIYPKNPTDESPDSPVMLQTRGASFKPKPRGFGFVKFHIPMAVFSCFFLLFRDCHQNCCNNTRRPPCISLTNFRDFCVSGLTLLACFICYNFYSFSISAIDNPVFAAIVSSATPAFLKFSAMSSAALCSPLLKPDFSPLLKPAFSPSFTPAS